MALLEKAAAQGNAYAMYALGCIHDVRMEHERAVKWFTEGADAGQGLTLVHFSAQPQSFLVTEATASVHFSS